MSYDLILTGGRIIDPSQSLDRVTAIGFSNGTVAAIGDDLKPGPGTDIRDISGKILTPGLIDLHTHVYWGGTSLGIDAEAFCRQSAVTTAIDTGSAGPGNFAGFRKHVIEKSDVRILAFLHVSFAGIYGFDYKVHVGESEDIRLMAPAEAAEVVNANRDVIVGIKVRVGRHASGDQGIAPLEIARQVADETGLILMAHIDEPPPGYDEVLDRLRPGDILTHAFRPFPNSPANAQGRISAKVIAARKRGIIFDIGHGMGSFAFKTARAMLAGGFAPDTISSDIHKLCIDGPAFDQVTTLSKFLCLGMELNEVIRASTEAPAQALKRPDLGTLKPGSIGDASLLQLDTGQFDYVDTVGEKLCGDTRLSAHGAIIAGKWWHPQ